MGVLITGMHRSGTSMLAEWISQTGLGMGDGPAFETDTASKRLWHALDTRLLDLPQRYFKDYVDRVQAVTLDESGMLRVLGTLNKLTHSPNP